jgi:hypothetical protein
MKTFKEALVWIEMLISGLAYLYKYDTHGRDSLNQV